MLHAGVRLGIQELAHHSRLSEGKAHRKRQIKERRLYLPGRGDAMIIRNGDCFIRERSGSERVSSASQQAGSASGGCRGG